MDAEKLNIALNLKDIIRKDSLLTINDLEIGDPNPFWDQDNRFLTINSFENPIEDRILWRQPSLNPLLK